MLRLSTEQRRLLADKVFDGANVAAGALIFGQFLRNEPFSVVLAAFGGTLWLAAAAFAVRLTKE